MLGLAGLVITYYYSQRTEQLSHEQMMKQLFTEFNARYSLLNDSLARIKRDFPTLKSLEQSEDLKQKAIDYFSLCAEQYYWFKKGRIDDSIWVSWKSGMNYWHDNVLPIRELWKKEMETSGPTSYYISKNNEFFTSAEP